MTEKDKTIIAGFEVKELEPFPAGEWPFDHDAFNMGTQVAKGIWIMYSTHSTEDPKPFYILDQRTGQRLRITPRIESDD